MIGAIIGDIAGSPYEGWSGDNYKGKDFEFLSHFCTPTDDSIMTLALAKAITDCKGDYLKLEAESIRNMQKYGRQYPNAGYGGLFHRWLYSENPKPYYSYGNGAAMRVSPCGFAASSLEEGLRLARVVTQVTHNHPEALKAAEAVVSAIFMGRTGNTMSEIRSYITEHYYRIDFTLDEIRPKYKFDVTCQGSVPQAFEAFFESTGFENAIRNAISIGGDSDTIAAITGGMAEAYYGVPEELRKKALCFLDDEQREILKSFEGMFSR